METEKVSTGIQISGLMTIIKTAAGFVVGYIVVKLIGVGGMLALFPSGDACKE